MKNRYLKIAIIAGFIALLLIVLSIRVNAQTTKEQVEQLKLLTEICVDIKYIKTNIDEIKRNNLTATNQIIVLENRVTRVEERQITIKENLVDISIRNNWFLGLVGSILLLMLTMQIRRNNAHKKGNGEENN